MKKFSLLAALAMLLLYASCEKPQTEAERNAQVEREVQQRLAAEHQTAEQQRLAQQQADLDAREQAVADREAAANQAASATPARSVVSSRTTTPRTSSSDDYAENDNGTAPQTYDTFYRKLEPYGAWRETADYGYVWQPQVAQRSRDWHPYEDGRWAYTDAGWTWVSEEPYGWATYHYGRWTRLRGVGWVWVPGDEWAPAWVSWRKSDEYVGWAPLPPEARFDRRTGIRQWADSYYDIGADEYVFIPNAAIGSQRIAAEVVPVEQNITIVNQTTNITNITYNNTVIVNQGPNYDELRARSRQPIERLRLERTNTVNGRPQASVSGGVLAVNAPVFRAEASQSPTVTGEPIPQTVVERNWTGNANSPEAERARRKMKSEATPPPDAPPKRYEKPAVVKAARAASATAAPATAASATPAATASATATATARPMLTPAPTATATPRATATASSTPRPSASPKGPGISSPAPPTRPSPAARASAAPGDNFRPHGRPHPSAAPAAAESAAPDATAIPVLSATPFAPSTPLPSHSHRPVGPPFGATPSPNSASTVPPETDAAPPANAIAPDVESLNPRELRRRGITPPPREPRGRRALYPADGSAPAASAAPATAPSVAPTTPEAGAEAPPARTHPMPPNKFSPRAPLAAAAPAQTPAPAPSSAQSPEAAATQSPFGAAPGQSRGGNRNVSHPRRAPAAGGEPATSPSATPAGQPER